jgi:hypothetical protein
MSQHWGTPCSLLQCTWASTEELRVRFLSAHEPALRNSVFASSSQTLLGYIEPTPPFKVLLGAMALNIKLRRVLNAGNWTLNGGETLNAGSVVYRTEEQVEHWEALCWGTCLLKPWNVSCVFWKLSRIGLNPPCLESCPVVSNLGYANPRRYAKTSNGACKSKVIPVTWRRREFLTLPALEPGPLDHRARTYGVCKIE